MSRPPLAPSGLLLAYDCSTDRLPEHLAKVFVRLDHDRETQEWIADSQKRPHGFFAIGAWKLLRTLMSDFDANGMLGTHDMFVLSTAHWQVLLESDSALSVLDIGAGDGAVTEKIASFSTEVTTTETSSRMAKRLRERGWICHEVNLVDDPIPSDATYDRVLLLNVIDRTDRPLTLIERARDLLASNGELVVCAPMPLRPHVQEGSARREPLEALPAAAQSWEKAAADLAMYAIEPLGLRVKKLARAPYLCRGDSRHPVSELDLAIFVCERA